MGSWSESCGFSGLEIREGDVAYLMLLGPGRSASDHGPFGLYSPLTTLLRGTYDDYGLLKVDDDPQIIQVFNQQSGLDLAPGSHLGDDDLAGRPIHRFWIHGEILDSLPGIGRDYPYVWLEGGDKAAETVGRAADLITQDRMKFFKETRLKMDEVDSMDVTADLKAAWISTILMRDRGISGRAEDLPYAALLKKRLVGNLDLEPVIRAQQRTDILAAAAMELRKKITPSQHVGPQHGGDLAAAMFARIVLNICENRIREYAAEDGDQIL